MIRPAYPADAPLLASLHDQYRVDWPDFSPEEPAGVRSAITDDGMLYLLLDERGVICLHRDEAHQYGFLDYPYAAPEDAATLISAALERLQGLRVECPLPAARFEEQEILSQHGFKPGRTQRRMLLRQFPDIRQINLPEGVSQAAPSRDELEALHNLVFPGHSKLAGWRTDPGVFPAIGLKRDSELLGYVLTACHASQYWLSELAVHPLHRRLGLGKSLVLLGLQQLKQAGATEVHLLVNNHHDQNAPTLYESVGFRTHRHTLRYVLDLTSKEQP